jgi:RNase P/RNase MRP subunit POP5
MREKERYLLFEWRKKKEPLVLSQVQDVIAKELLRQQGEFGIALCGPRFRIFALRDKGICIRMRREGQEVVASCMRGLNSFKQVHVAGSAAQASRASKRKFPQERFADEDLKWMV